MAGHDDKVVENDGTIFPTNPLDQALGEGHEPTEEVGPEASAPAPTDCEFEPHDGDRVEDAQFGAMTEVHESFVAEPMIMVPSPVDGLPVPADETGVLETAHPFLYETQLCVEDAREYVEVFADEPHDDERLCVVASSVTNWGEYALYARFGQPVPVAARSSYDAEGVERERGRFKPSEVIRRWGRMFVMLPPLPREVREIWEARTRPRATPPLAALLPVRPTREACRHYKRQVFANDDQKNQRLPNHFIVFRNCTARRSVGGAYMSLRDEAIYACEYRSPPDPATVEKYLDAKDRVRLATVPELVPFMPRRGG